MEKADIEPFFNESLSEEEQLHLAVITKDPRSVCGTHCNYGHISRLSDSCLVLKTAYGPVLINLQTILEIRPAKKLGEQ